ncbi:hypothetical protein SAMN05216421_0699 [Halopseudomonas xinjiangensis]|uniref:DUF3325 domain-containing protein n=1 Tax=Halopseudomonas xinjiangensis TaxID=487184 RepID=A0A1H1NJD4_9GAMM|nr:hypothetical protein [Halopseudomonas xinjiangensis]SDR99037.1 hypothetical protein SAMN05216421_0699 [Halopseudomonas xinjiangensis]
MIAYLIALSFLILCAESYAKTRRVLDARPRPDTRLSTAYTFLGGYAAPVCALGLLVWGFFIFDWWFPIVALIGCSAAIALIFGRFMESFAAGLVLISFPLGAVSCLYWLVA